MTLNDLLMNVQNLDKNLPGYVRDVMIGHRDDILEHQQAQLLDGKTAKGEDIRPYYSEDLKPGGYFKSAESAKRYADWKMTLSYPGQPKRNADAPNLYINGKFHSELTVDFDTDTLTIRGGSPYADGIVAKYGLEQFGLSEERWIEIWKSGGLDELMNKIRAAL